MLKKYIETFAIMVCALLITFTQLVGCTYNRNNDLGDWTEDMDHMNSIIYTDPDDGPIEASMSPEDHEYYLEENRRLDEARMKKYKHYYGDSDNYALVSPLDTPRAVVVHGEFIDPEKAFEQSLIDYQDAYEHVSRAYNLRIPQKGDLEAIKEFSVFCLQPTSQNDELDIKCLDLSDLLRTYRKSFM